MDSDFWNKKWQTNDITFHMEQSDPLLKQHFTELTLPEKSRIFLPLCGKILNSAWLLSKGYEVAGVELVETAIEQLFSELELTPSVKTIGKLKLYSAKSIDIYVGDIFDLNNEIPGQVNAEVNQLYGENFDLKVVEKTDLPGGIEGQCDAMAVVWLLTAKKLR